MINRLPKDSENFIIELNEEGKFEMVRKYPKVLGMIEMTKQDMIDLETAYNDAVKKQKGTFMFQERVVLTDYAKYVIEYLKGK